MVPSRRSFVRLVGVCSGSAVGGCLDRNSPNGNGNGNNGNGNGENRNGNGNGNGNGTDPEIETDVSPLAVRTDRPKWNEDDEVGRVVIIDSVERERAVLMPYTLSQDQREAIRVFLDGIDYDRERLVLIESVGPNACYDRLNIDSVRILEGELHADASVVATTDDETACAQVITFPSALARITFEDSPFDSITVDITDGWDEQAAITANTADPLGLDVDSLDGSIRPDSDPEPIASLACDIEDVEHHYQGFDEEDLTWGNVERDGETALALRIEETEYDYGDTARIRLTNVADTTVDTGNRAKYNLQVYTESGWEDVRVGDADRPFAYTDEAIIHPPGDGFEWSIELTESGIVEGMVHDHVEVCPDLESGRYRFVFWGVIGGAVGVEFDLRV